MAGDTVTTTFGGDDSLFQAAARKVQGAVAGLASFAPAMKFFHAAEAGAKGMHAATMQATAGVKGLESALGPLLGMATGLLGIAGIFESLKKGVMAAAGAETAVFHFTAIAGGADKARDAITALRKTGAETATGFGKLAIGAENLMEAGLSADQAAASMGQLQKISLNSGKDLDSLSDSYSRVLLKQDVTSKDLVRLAQAGIPGIAGIAEEFKGLERATAASDKAIDNELLHINQVFDLTQKRASAVDSFGSKIGLMQKSFEGWAKSGGQSFGAIVTQIDGVSQGVGSMSSGFGKEFTDGLKQMETETGYSKESLMTFMREGKIGYQDLVQAATLFREEQHKAETEALQTKKYDQEVSLLTQEKGLLDQVRAAVEKSTGKGGIFENLTAFFDTFEGKWQKVTYAINVGWKNFGDPLMQALKAPVDMLSGFLAGDGKKLASQFGGFLGGQLNDVVNSLKDGTFWQVMQQKGKAAFAEILKDASIGLQGLGDLLKNVIGGQDMITALKAFGDVLQDVMVIAADGFKKRMLTFHFGVSDEDMKKFDEAQAAADAKKPPSETVAKLATDTEALLTASAKVGSGIVNQIQTSAAGSRGKPAGIDQATWDMWYKPIGGSKGAATQPTAQPAEPVYRQEMIKGHMTTILGAPQASAGNASGTKDPTLAEIAQNTRDLHVFMRSVFA